MAPSTSRASSAVRTTSKPLRSALAVLALVGAPLAVPAALQAQEVVQRLPSAEERALTEALQILARNPDNGRALLTAGRSALALGDVDAALGFFSRARDADPGSGDALAGIAAVQVRRGDPVGAIGLFDAAGEDALRDLVIVAERGLAYDMVGDQARAQAIYRQALGVTRSDELLRRLSLSQAISGNRDASEATLLPLLQRQDKAAWRTRAFALAILGAGDEAVTVTDAVMPAGLAREMEPFLRIMPRLTRAQQAAAANLGRFPSATIIGRDTPEIAAYVGGPQSAPQARRQAGQGLVPQGRPLGDPDGETQARRSEPAQPIRTAPSAATTGSSESERLARQAMTLRERQRRAAEQRTAGTAASPTQPPVSDTSAPAAASAPSVPSAAVPSERQETPFTLPAETQTAQIEPVEIRPAETPAAAALPPSTPPSTAASPPASAPAPGFDLAQVPSTTRAEPVAEPAPDFASVFGDIGKPALDAAASEGAVDVTGIRPARSAPPASADPPPPANPARIWVQLGIGRDVGALAFDWRRLQRRHDQLEGRDAYRVPLGQTNRMVTGPFASRAEALQLVNALKEEGHESLVWRSEEGEELTLLPDG